MVSATPHSRRNFLQFLLGSPALAWAQQISPEQHSAMVESAKDALSVKDFEEIAQRKLPPAHWGYVSSGWTITRPTGPI